MKKRSLQILRGVALATILSTSSYAGEGFFDIGYANADINSSSNSGASIAFGAHFGEIIKQSIGFRVTFLGSDNSASEDKENIGDFYYNLGYEILNNTIVYGSIGYGFQSLGSVGIGQNATTLYATGLSRGAGIRYNFGKNFALDGSYKNYALSYEALKYDAKVANLSLVYRFRKK